MAGYGVTDHNYTDRRAGRTARLPAPIARLQPVAPRPPHPDGTDTDERRGADGHDPEAYDREGGVGYGDAVLRGARRPPRAPRGHRRPPGRPGAWLDPSLRTPEGEPRVTLLLGGWRGLPEVGVLSRNPPHVPRMQTHIVPVGFDYDRLCR
jgi:hypothetical protein